MTEVKKNRIIVKSELKRASSGVIIAREFITTDKRRISLILNSADLVSQP